MYNFRKIRSEQKSGEQKYTHNEFQEWKTMKEIQAIRKKIKKDEEKIIQTK